jgi:small subunit ribosomal protein S16
MALKIRLQRRGTTNAPKHCIVVAESKSPRDGKFVEELGSYDPQARGAAPLYIINIDRADYWLNIGAQASETVTGIIRKARKQTKNEKGIVIVQATASAAA